MITEQQLEYISLNIVKFCISRQLTVEDAHELNDNIKYDLGIIKDRDEYDYEYNRICDLWRSYE